MAWIEKRKKKFRLRDRLGGAKSPATIVKDLGIYKDHASQWLGQYKKALGLGFEPKAPVTVQVIESFIASKEKGTAFVAHPTKRLSVKDACAILLDKHGPSLKGGIGARAYLNYKSRLKMISGAWEGKLLDEINEHDVRDLLARLRSNGTVMRYLGTLTHIFNRLTRWNEKNILPFRVVLPAYNPGTSWRAEMKRSQKLEAPRTRVLTPEEWAQFSRHLKPRARAICEMALRRFLRISDIRNISHLGVSDGFVAGLQEKTGGPYSVPVLGDQPVKYDFTNFRRDFRRAQVAAGMDYPSGHPLHFSIRDFRRTGATWAYRKTRDLEGIRDMLGHTNVTTTTKYLNIDKADKVAIAQAVDALFG